MSNQENLRQCPSSSTSAETEGLHAVPVGRSAPGRSARIRLVSPIRFEEDDGGSGRVGGRGATRRCSPTAGAVVGIPGGMEPDEISDDVPDQRPDVRTKRVVTRGGVKAVVLGLVDVVQFEQLFQYPAASGGAPHWVAAAVVVVRAGVRIWPSPPPSK